MLASNVYSRKRRGSRIAAALIASICIEPFLLNALNALAAQKSAAEMPSRNRGKNNQPDDESAPTRPRRVDPDNQHNDDGGPIIRIALMTDVTAVTLSSSSGLIARNSMSDHNGRKVSGGQLRIELRQQEIAARLPEPVTRRLEYTVEVAAVSDPRLVRKISDDLKKKFSETPRAGYDGDAGRYRILIGRFEHRSDAVKMIERLRLAEYSSARIVTDEEKIDRNSDDDSAPDPSKDTNGKLAKHQSQSRQSADARGAAHKSATQRASQIAALDGERVIVTGDDRLIIVAAGNAGDDESQRRRGAETRKISAVRVNNKEYRGEIHAVVNSRGRINVINALPVEDYLRSVVPMELSPSAYPAIEALKAQTIAARSYALAHRGRHNSEGFDLYADARSQVYAGISAERELTDRVIEETRGLVAVHFDEGGNAKPIQALYTSNCGGRTESNEAAFGGKPLPYLRSVACAPGSRAFAGRDIVSGRAAETFESAEGRTITREVALAEVMGFELPRRLSSSYLRGTPDQDEVKGWIERAAQIARNARPPVSRGDITRLAAFAQTAAQAIYGEGQTEMLLSQADADYLLAGLGGEEIPSEARADVAMLLKNGALRLPADGLLKASASITRGYAIEILARALYVKSQAPTRDGAMPIASLKTHAAQGAENGRLVINAPGSHTKTQPPAREPRFTTVSTTDSNSAARSKPESSVREVIVQEVQIQKSADDQLRNGEAVGLEIENGAWLFRAFGGESYGVDRLTLIGGERVTYHLNGAGRVDFIEAAPSERSLSSDKQSSATEWQERISAEEIRRRLARSRINVGQIEDISPVALSASSRVIELNVIGSEGRARLHTHQIRSALGLKDNLFVIDRERDARGRVTVFIFTGRGWGHGVGMCQAGAYQLAKDGYSHAAILHKYYTGIKLQRVY